MKRFGHIYDIDIDDLNLKDFSFLDFIRGVVFNPKQKIEKLYIDTTFSKSKLCKLGETEFNDKSPYNNHGHRHPYTPIYDLILAPFKRKKINIAEFGIASNASMRIWRDYFAKAEIHGFEFKQELIEKAKKENLKDVYYHKLDVRDDFAIDYKFAQLKKKGVDFDVIIDDSSHAFEDQVRIISKCFKYLKTGGIIIIEDIYRYDENYSEQKFYLKLSSFIKYFEYIKIIDPDHFNKFTEGYDNNRLIILVRNDAEIS